MFIFIKSKQLRISRSNTMKSSRKNTTLIVMAVGTLAIFLVVGIVVGVTSWERKLELVHVVMRHGIRTPADTFPTDPHINDSLYPVGWGQLTNEGKLQLYEVGKYFRKRYGKFLGDLYWPAEYYTQSTDVDRTKASMQIVNAGLWPPKTVQVWGPLDWQPVPIHSEPLSQDTLLLVRKPCTAYHKERDRVIASKEVQEKFKDNQELFQALTKYTGRPVKDFDDVQDVFSTLKAEESFNLTLPEWTKDYYPDKMLEPTIFSFILNAWDDKMNRLKGGLLLKKIISDWKSKASGTDKSRKMFLYGGHDSTIVNLMRTLKVWDPQLPDYAITILLELSRDGSGTYGVEVFLRNSSEAPPHKLTIPGCNSFCPLDQLIDLTRNVIPENWEKECENDGSYNVPEAGGP